MWKKYKQELQKQGVSDDEIEKKQRKFLNVLENSFYVSTTVKTYNEYQNNIGFLGGSLGTDLDMQLARITDIFEQAGFSTSIKEDMEWLKFAILNSSPLSYFKNTSNQNIVENYLGSVAALALFDEGGAEATIVENFKGDLLKSVDKTETADILHLYKVNGVYVPGSYVLQQIIKSISKEVLPKISEIPNIMTRGAGVTIINKASPSLIVNRPIKKHKTSYDPQAWLHTGENIKETISIQILFLAGLLDIVNGINKTLGNVEFPN